jgi:hypothetical protein
MNEYVRIRGREKPYGGAGRLELHNGEHVSVLGGSRLILPPGRGRIVSRVLSIQQRLEAAESVSPRVARLLSLLNCRKTSDLLRGTAPLHVLVREDARMRRTGEIVHALPTQRRDADGLVEMFRDLEVFLGGGRPVVVFGAHTEGADRTNEHWLDMVVEGDVFPQTVHVFNVKRTTPPEVKRRLEQGEGVFEDFLRLGFVHTFEVLGRAEDGVLHCIHKEGPLAHQKVSIVSGYHLQRWILTDYGAIGDIDHPSEGAETLVVVGGNVQV